MLLCAARMAANVALSHLPIAVNPTSGQGSNSADRLVHALQVCEVQTLGPEGVQGQPARGVPHLHLAGGYTSMGGEQ